ncbi:hypothetical protein QTP86_021540 [Hemibagrus guttatus]|nr:hypothetical protein QTP86_021540 [Hemibagrus guttatus]
MPEDFEAVHSHTFRVKTFKKNKHCGVCKQTLNKEGLICRGYKKHTPSEMTHPCKNNLLSSFIGLTLEGHLLFLLNKDNNKPELYIFLINRIDPLQCAGWLAIRNVKLR